jgi:hypothetical protein
MIQPFHIHIQCHVQIDRPMSSSFWSPLTFILFSEHYKYFNFVFFWRGAICEIPRLFKIYRDPKKITQCIGRTCWEIRHLHIYQIMCRNPSLGLMTKVSSCKGACQEWIPRVTFHGPKSIGECEGMNPHTPKWASTLGVRVSMDSWFFRGRF